MDDDDVGKLILRSENLNSTLTLPQIPIKPNQGIPKTIGIFILLGGLIISVVGLSVLGAQFLEVNYDEQVKAYQLLGVDISSDELEKLDSEYKGKNYYLITGILQIFPGVILIIGGIQLFLCNKGGVYTSVIGGLLLFILNLFSNYWGSSIDNNLGISLETQWDIIETAMCSVCNLFCISLPLIALLLPSGRAALDPTPINQKNLGIEEE